MLLYTLVAAAVVATSVANAAAPAPPTCVERIKAAAAEVSVPLPELVDVAKERQLSGKRLRCIKDVLVAEAKPVDACTGTVPEEEPATTEEGTGGTRKRDTDRDALTGGRQLAVCADASALTAKTAGETCLATALTAPGERCAKFTECRDALFAKLADMRANNAEASSDPCYVAVDGQNQRVIRARNACVNALQPVADTPIDTAPVTDANIIDRILAVLPGCSKTTTGDVPIKCDGTCTDRSCVKALVALHRCADLGGLRARAAAIIAKATEDGASAASIASARKALAFLSEQSPRCFPTLVNEAVDNVNVCSASATGDARVRFCPIIRAAVNGVRDASDAAADDDEVNTVVTKDERFAVLSDDLCQKASCVRLAVAEKAKAAAAATDFTDEDVTDLGSAEVVVTNCESVSVTAEQCKARAAELAGKRGELVRERVRTRAAQILARSRGGKADATAAERVAAAKEIDVAKRRVLALLADNAACDPSKVDEAEDCIEAAREGNEAARDARKLAKEACKACRTNADCTESCSLENDVVPRCAVRVRLAHAFAKAAEAATDADAKAKLASIADRLEANIDDCEALSRELVADLVADLKAARAEAEPTDAADKEARQERIKAFRQSLKDSAEKRLADVEENALVEEATCRSQVCRRSVQRLRNNKVATIKMLARNVQLNADQIKELITRECSDTEAVPITLTVAPADELADEEDAAAAAEGGRKRDTTADDAAIEADLVAAGFEFEADDTAGTGPAGPDDSTTSAASATVVATAATVLVAAAFAMFL